MRPLKITMTAFGPYRDAEIVDFNELGEHRLFVISGSTGAGKTTIFDAICFALYGTASGEDRSEPRMLRSHFADDEKHTAVELDFAVGRRIYRVFRQLPHRKGTNKSETGGKAELYELTGGEAVPIVDRFMVNDVNAKLETIIGLTKEQFNQIVMLPQGEFRKLLTSDTDNKEEILRRIFRTELYQRLETRFQQQNRELGDQLKEAKISVDHYMKQAAGNLPRRDNSLLAQTLEQELYNAAQLSEALEQEIAYYRELAAEGEAGKRELQRQLGEQELALQSELALHARFIELAGERAKAERLAAQSGEHAERERRLLLAERAALLAPYAEQAVRAERDAAAKQQAASTRRAAAEAAKAALAAAEERHRREEERGAERQAAERELHRLAELAPAVETLEAQRVAVERLRVAESSGAAKLSSAEALIAEAKEAKAGFAAQLKAIEGAVEQLPGMIEQRNQVVQTGKYISRLIDLEKELAAHANVIEERAALLARIREEHDRLERGWIEGQASLLAAHLHNGQPCPVCGSEEHPDKAVAAEAVPSREQLQQAKEQLSRYERELNEAQLQAAAARSSWEGSAAELAEYGAEASGLAEQQASLRKRWKQLNDEAERLGQQVELGKQLKERSEEIEQKLDQLQQAKDKLQAEQQQIAVERGAKQSALEKELERIPEELRSPKQMEEQLKKQRSLAESLAVAWKQAQDELLRMRAKFAEEQAHAEQTEQQLAEARNNAALAAKRFEDELAKAEFEHLEAFRAAHLPDQERRALKDHIEAYKTAVAAVHKRAEELEQELAGKVQADTEAMKAAIAELKQRIEAAANALQIASRFAEDAGKLKASIDQAAHRVKELEAKLAQVLDLYQMLKGDNALKISFERYILIEYLEQILHAANVRLRHLSGGQFILQRSDRLETRGKQSGLGLDVYDAYTGQNRDVKTMSGGEKFNASLCLALGMTDVIQSYQGGVSIEMMFIDEGFGSLDEDSLNKAIEALVDLQRSGRMIGVISHVQELKQAFPATLEVYKTKEGYSRTSISVK
ncbi:AAA family ATPase [Paenibacillus glycanilyticus]|uniref:Nuclease SbcCD subunit C n=1 Tax=Paenibacillus glycanilyticus TaxID=126569 RepID=A0ABQ6G415_9BACL|nr:SMC family ATPase [Paenibacillus glycanilyticus]GLX65698.1 nuclease SbcCD subunit C [Paenibacillus glycanilyticus]